MTAVAVTLRSPSQLLAAVPYILGFHPSDSLVVIAVTEDRVGLTTRVDLPDQHEPDRPVQVLLPALAREAPAEVIIIAYENDQHLAPATSLPCIPP